MAEAGIRMAQLGQLGAAVAELGDWQTKAMEAHVRVNSIQMELLDVDTNEPTGVVVIVDRSDIKRTDGSQEYTVRPGTNTQP